VRPDLKIVRPAAEAVVTLVCPVVSLGAENVFVEVSAKPLRRRWLPRSCIVSPVGFDTRDVTLHVPLPLARRLGLVPERQLPSSCGCELVAEGLA
jgi:hypothetical protein